MKDLKVKRLSDYSEKDLQNLQLILSVAYQAAKSAGNQTVMKEADAWGYVVREALEDKRKDQWAIYEDLDTNPIGI